MHSRREFLGQLGATATALCLESCGRDEDLIPTPPRREFYLGVGIENTWMVQSTPTSDGNRRALDEYALTGHDDRWRDDLLLAEQLGVNCIRYSLPWPRIESAPRVYEFGALRERLEFLAHLGITPILDLIHYGTPAWMHSGIGDPLFPDALARYAEAVAEQLGGLVTHFTPYNEPQVAATLCGATGTWPPYEASPSAFAQLGVRIARAMVLCSRSLRSVLPEAVLISADPINWLLADALVPGLPVDDPQAEDLRGAAGSFPASLAYGKVAPNHRLSTWLKDLGVDATEIDWLHAQAEPPDILGYNHYPDVVDFPDGPDFTRDGSLPLEQAAREAAMRVEAGLRRAHDYFGLDVYLSETSAGLTPAARAAYAGALGQAARRLRGEGFPLVGLNWWPLIQAVQWDYRDRVSEPIETFFAPGGWNNALYDLALGNGESRERIPTEAVPAFRRLTKLLPLKATLDVKAPR